MCNVRVKRMLAFLLCFAMAVSGVSVVRADTSGEGPGTEIETSPEPTVPDTPTPEKNKVIVTVHDESGGIIENPKLIFKKGTELESNLSPGTDGNYDIDQFDKNVEYSVTAEKDGYADGTGTFNVTDGLNDDISVAITLKKIKTVTITVQDSDNNNQPIENATVKISSAEETTTTKAVIENLPITRQSNNDGNVTVPLVSGEYKVEVSADGYKSMEDTLSLTVDSPDTVFKPITMERQKKDVTIIVKDSNEKAIKDATVKIYKEGESSDTATGTSDSEGKCVVSLAPGEYTVNVSANNYIDVEKVPLTVNANSEDEKPKEITLETEASKITRVKVSVKNENNKKIESNECTFTDQDGEIITLTDDGYYDVSGIGTGEHTITITAKAKGYRAGSSETFTVTDGSANISEVTITLKKLLLEVNVTDNDTGKLISDVELFLNKKGEASGSSNPLKKEQDGTYNISDLDEGDYTITAKADDYVNCTKDFTITSDSNGSIKVEITMKAIPKASVNITVTSSGTAITEAKITVQKDGTPIQSNITANGNVYTIADLKNGNYEITISRTGYENVVKSFSVDNGVANPSSLSVNMVKPVVKQSTVKVIVLAEKDGQEIDITKDANLSIIDNKGIQISDILQTENVYDVSNLPNGTYTVTAKANGYEDGEKKFTVTNGSADGEIVTIKLTVKGGATETPSPTDTPTPSEKPSVTIYVKEAKGDPLDGVTIKVKWTDENGKELERYAEVGKEKGEYYVDKLDDGDYKIIAEKEGYKTGESTFEVKDGQVTSLDPPEITLYAVVIPTLTASAPAPQLLKKGETASLRIKASIENANYPIRYSWTWNGKKEKTSGDTLKKKITGIGKYTWKCEVTAEGDQGNKLTKTLEGIVIGYQASGIKLTLLKKYSTKQICDTVFGKSSGVHINNMKKKGNYLAAKKDKVWAKRFKKSFSVQLQGVKYGNITFKNISVKMETHLPLEVKFTKRNGGKKITCTFSKDLRQIVKNKKKYGIKQVKVKVWFSKDGKSFKAVSGAAKKYFQPTVAKSKCYITQSTKFKTKKFKAQITCKASGGTVKDDMKVTYK